MSLKSTYDVAIVGGGPAGSIVALLLARAGTEVALFEATDLSNQRIGETLPPEVNPLLETLGVSHVLSDALACPGMVSVWGSPLRTERDYLSNRFGNGWHVDRNKFDRALCNAAACAGADVLLGTSVRPHRKGEVWMFRGSESETRARFLVDASGRNGLRLDGKDGWLIDDTLVAIYLRLSVPPCPDKRGLVESTIDGWWYCAPLPCDEYVATFFTDPMIYREDGIALAEHLLSAPSTASRIASSQILYKTTVRVASAIRRRLWAEHWAAVGDAAVAHDPISGHGVLHALESARHFVERFRASNLEQYEPNERRSFATYRSARLEHYAHEKRWSSQPFWLRRQRRQLQDTTDTRSGVLMSPDADARVP